MAQTFQIQGLKEIEEALNNLPQDLQLKILGKVNKMAVEKFVVAPMRNAVPYATKTEANIKTTGEKEDKTAIYGGVTSDSFWLRFADLGTAERTTKSGAPKGRIVGRHTLESTILNSPDDVINFIQGEISNEMEKILKAQLRSTLKKLK